MSLNRNGLYYIIFVRKFSYSLREGSILSLGAITGFKCNIYSRSQNWQKRLFASLCPFVCLFFRLEQLGSHSTGFLGI